MEKDIDPGNAEERILQAATEIFAEKGYDAAGVDEIAKRANVTKPLIYYYFKGKKNILEEIINRYVKNLIQAKKRYMNTMDSISMDRMDQVLEARKAMFARDHKILKVIAMELLKEHPVYGDTLVSIIQPVVDIAMPKFEELGLDEKDRMDAIITGLFFGTVPLMAFSLFRDSFCQTYHMEPEELDRRFFDTVKAVYLDRFVKFFHEK